MHKISPRKLFLIGMGFCIVSLAVFGVRAWSPKLSFQSAPLGPEERKALRIEDLKVDNKTKGLTVASLSREGDLIRVLLQNNYPSAISSYKFSVGVALESRNFIFPLMGEVLGIQNEQSFPPGHVRQEFCPLQSEIETYGIKILAVILEDGTTDGDPHHLVAMQEWRMGVKMHRQHILRFLDHAVGLAPAKLRTHLARVETSSSPLSEEDEQNLPLQVRHGLNDEREHFLQMIHSLQATHLTSGRDTATEARLEGDSPILLRQRLSALLQCYQRKVEKL